MFPYTQNTGSLTGVITAIGNHGIPGKFTTKELPVWGFKSSNDRSIVTVLRFIGFIDGSGAPSDLWKLARTDPKRAVGVGARAGYAELFKTFPDAHRKDAEALTNFFKAKTSVADSIVKQMVGTFKALAQYGNFETQEDQATVDPDPAPTAPQSPAVQIPITSGGSPAGMTVNLNVELVVPTDATGEVYDKFFAAMRKHLLRPDEQ